MLRIEAMGFTFDLQSETRHTAVGQVWRVYAAFIGASETRRVLLTPGWVSWDDANGVYQEIAKRVMRHGDCYGPFDLPRDDAGERLATDARWRDRNAVDRSQLSERPAK